jgi:hypothetical protein
MKESNSVIERSQDHVKGGLNETDNLMTGIPVSNSELIPTPT